MGKVAIGKGQSGYFHHEPHCQLSARHQIQCASTCQNRQLKSIWENKEIQNNKKMKSIYARFTQDHVREAMEKHGKQIMNIAKQKPSTKFLHIKKRKVSS